MTGKDRGAHYFDPDPVARSKPSEYVISGPAGPLRVVTDTGVFSHGSLDTGTGLLLRHLEGFLATVGAAGDIVDLGCGAGPLALASALHCPSRQVWGVDTNRRALDLCAANAASNGITNVAVCEPDGFPPATRVAAIVSNPPVRIGKEAMREMLGLWLGRLEPQGAMILVVSRNLGADSLHQWLTESGHPTVRAASGKGYRVLVVRSGRG